MTMTHEMFIPQSDEEVLELRDEGRVGEGWVLFESGDEVTPKVGVAARKLVCEGGEDILEFLPVR